MQTKSPNKYIELLKEYNALEDRWILPDERFGIDAQSGSYNPTHSIFAKMRHQIFDRPTEETLLSAEQALSLRFSPQMREFLLKYGSVSIGNFETIDLIANDIENSPLVIYTQYFRNFNAHFPTFVVFHIPNEYDWMLCNENDTVFHCSLYTGKMESLHIGLMDYIAEEGKKAQRRMKRLKRNE